MMVESPTPWKREALSQMPWLPSTSMLRRFANCSCHCGMCRVKTYLLSFIAYSTCRSVKRLRLPSPVCHRMDPIFPLQWEGEQIYISLQFKTLGNKLNGFQDTLSLLQEAELCQPSSSEDTSANSFCDSQTNSWHQPKPLIFEHHVPDFPLCPSVP